MLTLTQLKDVFLKYGFAPLKRLGENYLIDGNIKDKIIAEIAPRKTDAILEIGPGFGALTMDLAASGAKVYAVEKDKKAFAILSGMAGKRFPNLKLFCGDIIEFDLKKVAGTKRIKVAGNLPYYITTPIVEYIVENRSKIESAVLTVQREVANRLLAGPGSEDYSSVSCFAQYYANPTYIHTIRRTSFYPAPEVDSSLIRLDILARPSVKVKDRKMLFRIVRGAFNQRRKSIINSLSRKEVLDLSKDELAAILARAGIDPSSRPEHLSLADFAKIAGQV